MKPSDAERHHRVAIMAQAEGTQDRFLHSLTLCGYIMHPNGIADPPVCLDGRGTEVADRLWRRSNP